MIKKSKLNTVRSLATGLDGFFFILFLKELLYILEESGFKMSQTIFNYV